MSVRDKARKIRTRIKSHIQGLVESSPQPSFPAPVSPHTQATPTSQPISPRNTPLPLIEDESWTKLKSLMRTLRQASVASGLGLVTGIIEGLIDSIQIFEDAAKGQKQYKDLRIELELLFDELQQYFSKSPIITTSIANICGSINKEIEYLKNQQARPATKRLLQAENSSDEVWECYRRIQGHLQRLSRNANVLAWILVDQLATMYQWATGHDTGNIYWMSGMAGTGKTTIAYSLCEQLDTDASRILCASFFCSRSLPECRDVGRIIPSIAYQLARCSRPFQYALHQAMEEDPDAHTRLPYLQFETLIAQPLSDKRVKEAFPTNMVVVIDALDECEDSKSTQQILHILLTKSRSLPIKFFISSRPEAAIRDQMKKDDSWIDSQIVLHELDSGEVQADIKRYLSVELAPINPSDSDIKQLVERAGVLFIYAATVIRYVGYDGFCRNPRARLKTVLGMTNHHSKIQTEDIDGLYTVILKAAFDDTKLEEEELNDMSLVLNTVICAKQPLTINALAGILKLEDVGQAHAALRPLWSVLHIVQSTMIVTTLHASFPDYLLDSTRSGGWKWHCNPIIHNHILARRCFEYIRDSEPQFNICELESSCLIDEEVPDLDVRIQEAIPIELYYACRYWPDHTESSQSHSASALVPLLEQFMERNLLLWMEVLNLKRGMDVGPGQLVVAKQWSIVSNKIHSYPCLTFLQRHGATCQLVNLIHDAWRFVLIFSSSPLSQSTPHIYVTMLPFLPPHSPLRKYYSHRMKRPIRVIGTALERRKGLLARLSIGGSDSATCSPDGTLMALGWNGSDMVCHISILDTSSGQLLLDISQEETTGRVFCVAFSPDSTRIASGINNTIWIWDVANGKLVLGPLEGHQDFVFSVLFSHKGSYLVSGSRDKTVRVWDSLSGRPSTASFTKHTNDVYAIAISSDDSQVVSGCWDGVIHLWDMQSCSSLLGPISAHKFGITSVAFSPTGSYVVSGSRDGTMRMWDSQTGQMLFGPFQYDNKWVESVAVSPDGAHILAGFDYGTIHVWDAATGKAVLGPLKEHSRSISMLWCSPDGTRIISYSYEGGDLCLFDAQSVIAAPNSFPGHTETILSIDISSDGDSIVSGSADRTVCVWDLTNGQVMLGPLIGHTRWVHFVRFSRDGSRVLSCASDRTIRQWNAHTGDAYNNVIGDTTGYCESNGNVGYVSADYSPDGKCIASISEDADIRLWNSSTGEMLIAPIQVGRVLGRVIQFSSDGKTLFTGCGDATVGVWDVQSGQEIVNIKYDDHFPNDSPVWALAFSSDGLYNIQCFSNPTICRRSTWRAEDMPGSFEGPSSQVESVRFSPDDTRIVAGYSDTTIFVWDVQTGNSVWGPLRGHTNCVNSVAYFPDGRRVASASEDTAIRIWDVDGKLDDCPNKSDKESIEWVLAEDGWVMDKEGRRLVWVPHDLRVSLMSPKNTMLLHRDGYVKLDFEGACIGDEWASSWIDI
ncbi:WD40 repeat-like protein [Rhizoctonia solani]|uniref:WD40 repeat-like protein n=1 Tax=Rhizoctonia solani TaxID=456999 RepID=A0A8H7LGM8_9AGAM|nr:WD40 repeat-like protein [Rhizoctonia solani]